MSLRRRHLRTRQAILRRVSCSDFRDASAFALDGRLSALIGLGSVHLRGTAMVDCSLVGVALVELIVLSHHAALDLPSLVLLPAVLESSTVLILCTHRRGLSVQQLSQLVLPYAVYTLRMTAIALCRAPPEHAAAGRSLVCQSRIHVRVALHWICVPVACSVSKSYAVDNPTL